MSERLTKSQAGSAAKCCEKTLEMAIRDGLLPAIREHGRVLIDSADLERWIAGRQARTSRRRRCTFSIDWKALDALTDAAEASADQGANQ